MTSPPRPSERPNVVNRPSLQCHSPPRAVPIQTPACRSLTTPVTRAPDQPSVSVIAVHFPAVRRARPPFSPTAHIVPSLASQTERTVEAGRPDSLVSKFTKRGRRRSNPPPPVPAQTLPSL